MLKSVTLRNFLSFRDAQVNLGPRNFLVGPNMAGKSNFIEFFHLLRRVAFPRDGGAFPTGLGKAFLGGFPEYAWKGGDPDVISVSVQGTAAQGGEWEYELSLASDQYAYTRVQEERLSLTDSNGSHELIVLREGARTLVNKDGKVVSSGLDSSRAALEFEIPGWDGLFLRNTIGSWRFYHLIPPLMRQPNPTAAPFRLAEEGADLSAWLMQLQTEHHEAFAKIRQVCCDVLPSVESLFTSPSQQATVTVKSRERHLKRPVSLLQMSDGELAFIALLSLIFSPQELSGSLYCIEEPENYLHPRLIETLVELIRQRQGEPGTPPGQIIATTHSLSLIDKLALDELIVMEKREGATVVSYPRDKSHLKELLEREELGLGDLYYSGALGRG